MIPSYLNLLKFFVPLIVISFSQAFTYPLVASIISHGPLAEREYESYVIGQQVVAFLSSIGYGLITTGMVFSTSKKGLKNYSRLNLLIGGCIVILQLTASLPIFEYPVFGQSLGVREEELRHIARRSVMACIPVQLLFFIRNIFCATLFRMKRSDLANIATLVRIAIAIPCSFLFCRYGLTGYLWGAFAMTVPCFVEMVLSWYFARPYHRNLPPAPEPDEPDPSVSKQLAFTIPLCIGNVLMTATAFVSTWFLGHTSDPALFRPVHFVAYGLSIPFLMAAFKIQTVTVAFVKSREAVRRIFNFAVMASAGLFLIPVALILTPSIANWYICDFQNMPSESLKITVIAIIVGSSGTIVYALRGFLEGFAAVCLRSGTILSGQLAYVVSFVITAFLCKTILFFIPGYLWIMTAIITGSAVSALAMFIKSRKYKIQSECQLPMTSEH